MVTRPFCVDSMKKEKKEKNWSQQTGKLTEASEWLRIRSQCIGMLPSEKLHPKGGLHGQVVRKKTGLLKRFLKAAPAGAQRVPSLETCHSYSLIKGSENSCNEICLTSCNSMFSILILEVCPYSIIENDLVFGNSLGKFVGLGTHNFAQTPTWFSLELIYVLVYVKCLPDHVKIQVDLRIWSQKKKVQNNINPILLHFLIVNII